MLCHSPVGDSLRVRCRQFPSLINCTTIDWFSTWPKEALTSVARQFLKDEDLGGEDVTEAMCDMCAELHWAVEAFGDRVCFIIIFWCWCCVQPPACLDFLFFFLTLLLLFFFFFWWKPNFLSSSSFVKYVETQDLKMISSSVKYVALSAAVARWWRLR